MLWALLGATVILTLTLTSCVILSRWLNISRSWYPHLKNGYKDTEILFWSKDGYSEVVRAVSKVFDK